jgi:hypothetical protein
MALIFPPAPALNQRYTANPGTSGETQYQWDGVKWNAVLSTVSLGTANQDAYNDYQWSNLGPAVTSFLESDAAGNLSWTDKAAFTNLFVALNNPGAYNNYVWPAGDGLPGQQLTTDGAGNLTWANEADSSIQALGVFEPIDGLTGTFTLVKLGTGVFYTPNPPQNLVVFLGGVPQIPTAYSISGNQITFPDIPPAGTTFYGISNVVV